MAAQENGSYIPEFLLDTSVFRTMSRETAQQIAANSARAVLRASYHVPMELLTGLDTLMPRADLEREYRFRRGTMRRYMNLVGIQKTYWEPPDEIVRRAFGVSRNVNVRDAFRLAIMAMVECETRDEFEQILLRANALESSTPTLQSFSRMDADLVNNVSAFVRRGITTFRSTPVEIFERAFYRSLMVVVFAGIAGIHHMNESALKQDITGYILREAERLQTRYDGSLDFAIEANRLYLQRLHNDAMARADRNDPFDFFHFGYLRPGDPNQVFVSQDAGLRRLAADAAPERVISMDEFIDRMTTTE